MEFLKRMIGTKTFWTGLASVVGGAIFLAQGKTEVGAVMVTQGVGMIFGRDALAKLAKDNGKALIVIFALSLPLSGCATLKTVAARAGDAVKDTGAAIVEDVDWRQHLRNFIDAIFAEEVEADEQPEEAPAVEPGVEEAEVREFVIGHIGGGELAANVVEN